MASHMLHGVTFSIRLGRLSTHADCLASAPHKSLNMYVEGSELPEPALHGSLDMYFGGSVLPCSSVFFFLVPETRFRGWQHILHLSSAWVDPQASGMYKGGLPAAIARLQLSHRMHGTDVRNQGCVTYAECLRMHPEGLQTRAAGALP